MTRSHFEGMAPGARNAPAVFGDRRQEEHAMGNHRFRFYDYPDRILVLRVVHRGKAYR